MLPNTYGIYAVTEPMLMIRVWFEGEEVDTRKGVKVCVRA